MLKILLLQRCQNLFDLPVSVTSRSVKVTFKEDPAIKTAVLKCFEAKYKVLRKVSAVSCKLQPGDDSVEFDNTNNLIRIKSTIFLVTFCLSSTSSSSLFDGQ